MKYVESMSFNEDGACLGWTEEESMNISRFVNKVKFWGHLGVKSRIYFRSALTSIVLSDLSKDRLIGLLPKRSKKPKQGLETILELDERLRARNLRSRFLLFDVPKQNRNK